MDPNNQGRKEIRKCYVVEINQKDIEEKLFDNIMDWKDLKTVAVIESTRINKQTGETTIERKFYISSLERNAKEILQRTRKHWAIENSLHYV